MWIKEHPPHFLPVAYIETAQMLEFGFPAGGLGRLVFLRIHYAPVGDQP